MKPGEHPEYKLPNGGTVVGLVAPVEEAVVAASETEVEAEAPIKKPTPRKKK